MSNFFLLNEALPQDNFEEFKGGFSELIIIDKEKDDLFLRHDSLWQLDIINDLYLNYTAQEESVICKFIEQLSPTENYFNNSKEFDEEYKEDSNGFLGINFSHLAIEDERRIRDNKEYFTFNHNNLWDVNFRNFWKKRERLFPNLIMCGQVQNQISLIGNSGYFSQIIDKLKEFDTAINNWNTGNFNYRDMNTGYALRISPESNTTMSKYGNERICQLPNGGTDFFELHIKTGDLRFHFLPDNNSKKVYVGYIGPHLTIATS